MPSATSTNTLHNAYMKFLLHGTPMSVLPAANSNYYIGLFTTLPTLAGTGGTEVTGGSYVRQPIARAATHWSADGSGANLEYSNTVEITFPVPSANWGTIVGGGLFTAASAGDLLYVSSLVTPKTVNNGDGAPRILVGQWRIARAAC